MIPARLPPDEERRLAALASYEILDTLPESQLDDITRLAATICGVPIALVSLIDRNRQWFKSRQGLAVPETPREVAFCSHAILEHDHTMIVEDSLLDVRFHDNPLVTGEPIVRFYAGAPLVVASGECIGTLCVIDHEPRTLTAQQIDALRTLARHVVTYLELRHKSIALEQSERQLQLDIDERKRAEEMLDRFFHLSLDLLCVAGTDGRFKRLNPAFTEVLGYTEEELLARPFVDLVHPDDREATITELRKLADGRPTLRFENRYLHRDGGVRWIAWTASPVAETGMIYAAARDVTDAKLAAQALHASESAMRSIIGSSLSGIVTFSREGGIASVNPAAEKILGYSEAELLGRDISGLLPESPADLQSFVRTSVDYALGRITEWNLRRGDGTIVPVEMALFEFETSDGKHLACNLQDVSERREVETMKREFVATVSHELRTPLTSIRGSLDLLKGEVLGPLTPQAAEVTAIAHRNTTRLIKLINDILDLDRLDSGKMEMNVADTDAATIIRTAAESVRAFAEQSAVEIVATASDDALRADADRIVQVLVNLLSNAIKFSPRDSSVRLTARHERGEIVFEVEDHGRGIPRQYLDRIFDRFQQVESSDSRTKGGSGLGLAICKAIIEQHEGSIGVVSEEGAGSTFTVRLPLAPRLAGGPAIGVFSTGVFSRIDDSRDVVASTLRRQGYEVVALHTARQVRTAIESGSISLLIVDSNGSGPAAGLPGRLRALREQHDVPIFVIAPPSASAEWIAESLTVFVPGASQSSLLDAIRSCISSGAAQSDVLIVEDDAELLSVLQKQLERDGIAVRAVAGGREALAMIRAVRPRLIVLDVGLPDIDGFDLVAILRSDETLRALPLLVYTGRYLDGADRARLTLGPTRFLTKSTADDREFRRLVGELIRPVQGEVTS